MFSLQTIQTFYPHGSTNMLLLTFSERNIMDMRLLPTRQAENYLHETTKLPEQKNTLGLEHCWHGILPTYRQQDFSPLQAEPVYC